MKKNAVFVYNYEFGYELLSFQGILRKHRNFFDNIYICSYADREFLYKDFSNRFIPIPYFILNQFTPIHSPDFFPSDATINYLKDEIKIDSSFDIFITRKIIYPHYPLGLKLDLNGECGEYIDFPTSENIEKDKIISIFPRNHTVHDFRNYDIHKFKTFVDLIRKNFNDYKINIILFDNPYYSQKSISDFKIEGIEMIINPSIQKQIDIHARSAFLIYNHSGSIFLTLFNKERTPVFTFTIKRDYDKIYGNKNNIFFKRLKANRVITSNTDNISDIDPQYMYESFADFVRENVS